MAYYITKDCGAGWDQWPLLAWGVSTIQKDLAKRLRAGDVLLHYIDHVRVWAGYSEVTGPLQNNTRDKDRDWRVALPFVLPVRNCRHLSRLQCELMVALPGVSDRHRQPAFTKVPDEQARLIVAAVDEAALARPEKEDSPLDKAWAEGADGYYGGIVKFEAGYKCEVCKADGLSWVRQHLGSRLRRGDESTTADWFLEAAHIVPRHKGGPATPDNLRALCRNCHHAVDRLPDNERIEYLRGLRAARRG